MHRRRTWAAAILLLLGTAFPAHAAPAAPAGSTPPATATGTLAAPAASGTGTVPAEFAGFQDLPAGHWAHGSVMALVRAGVITPDPTGRFRPEEPVQRAELFKMVLLARRKDLRHDCEAMFRDVPCSSWYAPVAETAYRMGIADGVGTDLFGADLYVSRQQLFTIIIRGVGRRWEAASQSWTQVSQRLAGFKDAARIADWARPPLALAVSSNLAGGYTDGTFRPEAIASRAEAAALVSRILLPEGGVQVTEVDGRTITVSKAFEMKATMYATGEPGVGTVTYTGMIVRTGAIAVDPAVIPLGSLLYVEGYGYGVAADIGGAIKGHRVDLFTHSHREAAIEFGIQNRKVWVLP